MNTFATLIYTIRANTAQNIYAVRATNHVKNALVPLPDLIYIIFVCRPQRKKFNCIYIYIYYITQLHI